MSRSRRHRLGTLWLVLGLVGLLLILASLQNRWLTRLSEDERHRLRGGIESSAVRFSDDFDRELSRVFFHFIRLRHAEGDELLVDLQEQYGLWKVEAPHPDLVKTVYIVTRRGNADTELRRVDLEHGRTEPSDWPVGLESHRAAISRGEPAWPIAGSLPGLVIPVGTFFLPRPVDGDSSAVHQHVIVELSREYIAKAFLPELTRRYFARGEGLELDVSVLQGGSPGRVVFQTGEHAEGVDDSSPVTEQPMFSIRRFPELTELRGHPPFGSGPGASDDGRPPPNRPAPVPFESVLRQSTGDPFEGQWKLVVTHAHGTLDDAVHRMHVRQLALSLSVLLLLGVSGIMVILSSQHAQRLARQQLEFVAAVSHELCTPLTAMRSAGQNLADGVVSDPEQVRKYGSLIEREGRRLTEMVNGVMAFAGIISGLKSYARAPISIEVVIDAVLDEWRPTLQERGFVVEQEIAPNLPEVAADALALHRAFSNLIDNAVKYAGSEKWIGIRACRAAGDDGDAVQLTVSDRGRGIPKADLPHLFEPFYRGAEAMKSAAGSGLGLSVVRHVVEGHGGTIVVANAPGKGTAFTIRLPIAVSTSRAEGERV